MWSHAAGRVCRGVELDPLYVDVIVRRFEAATGNQAVLVETGETFEALATQGAGTGVGLRPAPAVADVADEPPRNGRLLPVKRAGACTAEVRGSKLGSRREPPWVLGAHSPSTIQCVSARANGLRPTGCLTKRRTTHPGRQPGGAVSIRLTALTGRCIFPPLAP